MRSTPLGLILLLSSTIAVHAASSATVTADEISTVFLDGEKIGTTPMHIARLDPGSHRIKVTGKTSRRTRTFAMEIPSGISVDRTFHADLALASTPPSVGPLAAPLTVSPLTVAPVVTSAVNVETDAASMVLLDGQAMGQGSLRLTGVTPGVHVIEVVDTVTGGVMAQHLSVPAGVGADLTVPLRFHPTIGTLIVPTVVVRPFPGRPRWPRPVLVVGRGGPRGHHHRRFGRF